MVCACVRSFYCMYLQSHSVTENTSSSVIYKLFADVKEVIKEIRSDWYSLAIELDIDYDTRKVRDYYLPLAAHGFLFIFQHKCYAYALAVFTQLLIIIMGFSRLN